MGSHQEAQRKIGRREFLVGGIAFLALAPTATMTVKSLVGRIGAHSENPSSQEVPVFDKPNPTERPLPVAIREVPYTPEQAVGQMSTIINGFSNPNDNLLRELG